MVLVAYQRVQLTILTTCLSTILACLQERLDVSYHNHIDDGAPFIRLFLSVSPRNVLCLSNLLLMFGDVMVVGLILEFSFS